MIPELHKFECPGPKADIKINESSSDSLGLVGIIYFNITLSWTGRWIVFVFLSQQLWRQKVTGTTRESLDRILYYFTNTCTESVTNETQLNMGSKNFKLIM